MEFKKEYVWIGIVGVLFGFLVALQYKYYNTYYLSDSTQYEKMMTELSVLRKEKKALQEEIVVLQDKLDGISNSASQESALVKNLTDDLNRVKSYLGLTTLTGPGIVITIDDVPQDAVGFGNDKNLAYDYRLILDLINELHASGAEAVSINGQRIINYSEIRLVGRQLNVNFVPLTTPYVVKVIGDYDTLNGAITQKFGIIPHIRESGYYAEVRVAETIEVPAYSGIIKFDYAKVVE